MAIHNSVEKGLKESILQLSTPESMALYTNHNFTEIPSTGTTTTGDGTRSSRLATLVLSAIALLFEERSKDKEGRRNVREVKFKCGRQERTSVILSCLKYLNTELPNYVSDINSLHGSLRLHLLSLALRYGHTSHGCQAKHLGRYLFNSISGVLAP